MDNQEKIKEIAQEILEKMDIEGTAVIDSENKDFLRINIETPEAGFLIGKGGENLRALQQIIRSVVSKKTDSQARFIIDINDYQKGRLDLLRQMAKNLAKEALKSQTPLRTAPMGAYERRAVHIELAKIEGIETESEGTGEEKNIVIRPK